MFWSILAQILSFLLDLATVQRRSNQAKDLEILVLRHQLRVLQRRLPHPSRPSRWEKLTLAIKLRDLAPGLRTPWCQSILLFKPDTILRWHRQLVRQKWIFRQRTTPGRPSIAGEIEDLIVQLARENPRWGYSRVHGELCKLGYTVGRSTIRDILKRHRIGVDSRVRGALFSATIATRYWPVISSLWRRFSCELCTCSSSLSWAAAVSISLVAPDTPTWPGSPNMPGSSVGISRTVPYRFAF